MFKSKPIGWITAGTLLCLAGVALACRLKDGKEGALEANAACPDSTAEPPAPKRTKEARKVKARGTAPADASDTIPPPPSDGVPGTMVPQPPQAPPSAPPADPPAAVAPAELVPTPPMPEKANSAPPKSDLLPPVREPQTNLLKPVPPSEEAIRPVSGMDAETKPGIPPGSASPVPSPPPIAEKKGPDDEKKTAPGNRNPTPPSRFSMPMQPACPPPGAPMVPPTVPPTTPPVPSEGPPPPPDGPPMPAPTYKVGDRGETFRDIARRTLGSEEHWKEIDQLNPELRSLALIPAGKMVLLPRNAQGGCNVSTATSGGSETQDARPAKTGASVRPLPVVRSRTPESQTKAAQPLTGTFSCQLDDKHSLVLPKEVCVQLGKTETVLLTPGTDKCLWLCTQAGAARVLERIEKSAAADREVQAFHRLYYAQSEKAAVDASGKLAVSDRLAEYAGLGKEIVLIGAADHFELWDAAGWQRYSQQKDSNSKP